MRARLQALTHRGLVREHNEDCVGAVGWMTQSPAAPPASWDILDLARTPVLGVVCDGVGGHRDGAWASRTVVEACMAAHGSGAWQPEGLIAAAQAALVRPNEHSLKAPASTVVLAGFDDTECVVAAVGDSRAYRVQDGYVQQLTRDDRVDSSNALTQVLSGTTAATPQVLHFESQPDLRLVLLTDGVTDAVPEDDLRELLGADGDLCASLLEAACAAGGPDNLSVLVCDLLTD